MICYAEQYNKVRPAGGTSGTKPICVATPVGFFIGDVKMKRIPLTQGKFALVDDEDYERLSKFKWFAYKHRHTYYAVRNKRIGNGQTRILMHREILDVPEGMETDHINHNGWDNRRCNLRAVTTAQNQWNSYKQYRGTSWDKRSQKWQAQIAHNGKQLHLGFFAAEQDARQAYIDAKLKLRGKLYCDGQRDERNQICPVGSGCFFI